MKNKKKYAIFMLVFALFIVINTAIHVYKTRLFNDRNIVMSEEGSEHDCEFLFYPQNNKQISWTRAVTIKDEPLDLNACSYEGVFSNGSSIEVADWTLRLDINSDCYLNSAWCGEVEIHQNVLENEKVQRLDLRNLSAYEIILENYEDGDITLFPLKKGDYLIYYPNRDAKEMPVAAAAVDPTQVGIGIIFYWEQPEDFTAPSYEVNFRFNRKLTQGAEATVGGLSGVIWILLLIILIAVFGTEYYLKKKSAIKLAQKDIERKNTERMLDEMIKVLASTIDAKDEYTHGHSERVAQYSLELAQNLGLPSTECKEVFYAGLVHDVGKIAIPIEIINKPGRLTDEEFELIKSHPECGAKILSQIKDMPYLMTGAKHHHEKYDGSGYPSHLAGEEIPKIARIIAVADAYDAMTSQRSYRNTLDQKIVKQEIWKGIGTQFDPLIAKHMIAMIDADVEYDMREKPEETYSIIDEINKVDYWENHNPSSIKSVDQLMSETDIKFFGQFISTVDFWFHPVMLSKVTTEKTVKKFVSRTNEDAAYIWNAPTAIFYSSSDGVPASESYEELAVYMGAGYSWKTGEALFEENSMTRKPEFGNWDNWVAHNKEGMEYTITFWRDGDVIEMILDNELTVFTGRVTLPEDFKKNIYCLISGEYCDIKLN